MKRISTIWLLIFAFVFVFLFVASAAAQQDGPTAEQMRTQQIRLGMPPTPSAPPPGYRANQQPTTKPAAVVIKTDKNPPATQPAWVKQMAKEAISQETEMVLAQFSLEKLPPAGAIPMPEHVAVSNTAWEYWEVSPFNPSKAGNVLKCNLRSKALIPDTAEVRSAEMSYQAAQRALRDAKLYTGCYYDLKCGHHAFMIKLTTYDLAISRQSLEEARARQAVYKKQIEGYVQQVLKAPPFPADTSLAWKRVSLERYKELRQQRQTWIEQNPISYLEDLQARLLDEQKRLKALWTRALNDTTSPSPEATRTLETALSKVEQELQITQERLKSLEAPIDTAQAR